jgi:hypothetical protein
MVAALRWNSRARKLPQIAQEQGVSYNRLKRQRQRLLTQMTVQLRKAWCD